MGDQRAEGGAKAVKESMMELRRAQRKIKFLEKELERVKEAKAQPYECNGWSVWVLYRDLQRLVRLACQVNDDYDDPWLARVLEANKSWDANLGLIYEAIPAFKMLLSFPYQLPLTDIPKVLEEQGTSSDSPSICKVPETEKSRIKAV